MKIQLTLIASLGTAGLLAACATGPSTPRGDRFDYICENGERPSIFYQMSQGTATLVRGGSQTDLRRTSSPENTFYRNAQTTVLLKPDRNSVNMQVAMMQGTDCNGRQVSGPTSPIRPMPPVAPVPPIAPAPPVPPPAEMRVSYRCDNGEQVDVRFFPQQGIGVLVRGGQNTELNQTRTPPGFTYSNGQTTLRVSDDRLTMQMNVGMMATANCRAR
jgi:hypothetical protein